jgi:hypothetical protein
MKGNRMPKGVYIRTKEVKRNMKIVQNCPKLRAEKSKAMKEIWNFPGVRAKRIKAMKEANNLPDRLAKRSKRMMGNKNPMTRPENRGKNHYNWRPRGKEYTRWQEYELDVDRITKHQSLHLLKNYDKPRGRAGTEGAYQVDHIISKDEGFKQGIPAEEIANIKNLRIISWEENARKHTKCVI